MPIEATILLVKADDLPDKLDEQLEKKGIFVEEAELLDLVPSVVAVAPDIVVSVGAADVDQVLEAVERQSPSIPLVVLVTRPEQRKLRDSHQDRIAALVPRDLPVAALAHRLATMGRRAVEGEPLQRGPAPAAPKTSASTQATDPEGPKATTHRAETAVPSRAPSAEAKTEPMESQKEARVSLAALASPGSAGGAADSPAERPSFSAKPSVPHRPPGSGQKQRPAGAAARRRLNQTLVGVAPAPGPAAGTETPDAQPGKTSTGSDAPRPKAPTPINLELASTVAADQEVISPFASSKEEQAPGEPSAERPPTPIPPAAPPGSASEEIRSRVANADRIAKSHRREGAADAAVRIALIDDDLTRADAIAGELREHGVDVMLLSPVHAQARWPALRSFAPHGMLVDERSLSKGARTIVGAFRRDFFLKYVPLVTIRFDRLFDEAEGKANVHAVLPMLEPLGKQELALLEELGTEKSIEVDLSQTLPTRLLEIVAEGSSAIVLTCSSKGETLTWPLAPGRAGRAQLSKEGEGSGALNPGAALMWLLEREEPKVEVKREPQAELRDAEPIDQLLRQVTHRVAAPAEHSLAPPPRKTSAQGSEQGSSAESPGRAKLPSINTETLNAARDRVLDVGRRSLHTLTELTDEVRDQVRQRKADAPPWAVWAAAAGVGFLFVLLIVLLFRGCGSDDPTEAKAVAEAPAEKVAPPPKGPKNTPEPQESPQAETANSSYDRWYVARDAELSDCKALVGTAVANEPVDQASSYWGLARSALMRGDVKEAHQYMCRGALIDEGGSAALGVAEYYLSRRSLANAELWVKNVLKAQPGNRKAQELLSDIHNQRGDLDEARRVLLSTLKLSGDESDKLALVSRKFVADGQAALRSGDKPRAERTLRRAALLNPQNVQAAEQLAELFLGLGLREAARLWAEHASGLDKASGTAHMVLGDVARHEKDFAAARKHYGAVPDGHEDAAAARAHLSEMPANE